MSQRQEMLGAVMYCPQSIPTLFKHHNKDILHKQLMSLLNRRLGVEIECCGSVLSGLKDVVTSKGGYYTSKSFKKFKLPFINISGIDKESIDKFLKTNPDSIIEHRISFYGYRQLVGVYNFLEEMKKKCKYSESGIHIHVDITELRMLVDSIRENRLLISCLNKHIPHLEQIANYTGEMMKNKSAGLDKSHWINICSGWSRITLEFRVFPMTFEYHELIKFCLCATEITNKAIKEFKSKTKRLNDIKKIHLKKRSIMQ